MRYAIVFVGLLGCGDGGGVFGVGASFAWHDIEIEDLTEDGAPLARVTVEQHLRVLHDQALVREVPFGTIELVDPEPEEQSVVRRRVSRLIVPTDVADGGAWSAACGEMLSDSDVLHTLHLRSRDPDSVDPLEHARLLCTGASTDTVQRVRDRWCGAHEDTLAQDLLFPLPTLAGERPLDLDWSPVPADGLATAMSEGAIITAAEGTARWWSPSGEEIRAEALPGLDWGLVGAREDLLFATSAGQGLARRRGDGAWERFGLRVTSYQVRTDALWWVDADGAWRLPHYADAPEPVRPPEGHTELTLVERDGRVWFDAGGRPLRFRDGDWVEEPMPRGRWSPWYVEQEDGWGVVPLGGGIARIRRDGAVHPSQDVCSARGFVRLFTDGRDIAVVRGSTWALVPGE